MIPWIIEATARVKRPGIANTPFDAIVIYNMFNKLRLCLYKKIVKI